MSQKPTQYRLWIMPRNGAGAELPIEVGTPEHLIALLSTLLALGDLGPLGYRLEPYRPLE